MVYNSKSSQLSKLKQAKQLLASVLSQVSPLQGILRELEHDLQPQVQQAFLDAMLAFEAFYNLNDAIAATTRDSGNNQKHLEAEAKHSFWNEELSSDKDVGVKHLEAWYLPLSDLIQVLCHTSTPCPAKVLSKDACNVDMSNILLVQDVAFITPEDRLIPSNYYQEYR
ncbi:MAG: hypothetical protein Q9205_008067 [Flavoplaca limonia]